MHGAVNGVWSGDALGSGGAYCRRKPSCVRVESGRGGAGDDRFSGEAAGQLNEAERGSSVAEGASGAFHGRSLGVLVTAAAEQKHGEAEDEHDDSPDEIDVHPGRAGVDVAAARDEAVDGEQGTDDEEHQTHGDTEIEAHWRLLFKD